MALAFGIILVQSFLNDGHQPIDLGGIIHIDEKLHVGAVLIFRGIDEQEAQAAAADERGDMGDAGLGLEEAFDLAGERLGFADMGAGRQEGIHHELRPGRRREEALVHFPESEDRSHEGAECRGPPPPSGSAARERAVSGRSETAKPRTDRFFPSSRPSHCRQGA